jgi:hypothetical protein
MHPTQGQVCVKGIALEQVACQFGGRLNRWPASLVAA